MDVAADARPDAGHAAGEDEHAAGDASLRADQDGSSVQLLALALKRQPRGSSQRSGKDDGGVGKAI